MGNARFKLLAATLLAFSAAGPCLAADKIVSSLHTGSQDGAATSEVSFAYASCVEECHVATLVCEPTAAVTLVMGDVDSKIAAKAIVQSAKQVVLKAGTSSFDFTVRKMEFMEMTGSWWLTAGEQGSAAGAITGAIGAAKTIVLSTGPMTVTLPVDQKVKTWAKGCK